MTLPVSGGTHAYTFVPYNKNTVVTGNPSNWFNPLMFQLPPVGQIGDVGRSLLRGPGLTDWDFSLNKDTKVGWLGEAGMIEFRTEMFNILNHANFGAPSSAIYAGILRLQRATRRRLQEHRLRTHLARWGESLRLRPPPDRFSFRSS